MKMLIWGTGLWSKNFVVMSGVEEEEIIGYVESCKSKDTYQGKPVYAANEVNGINFDIIIVASSYTDEIKQEMDKQGIDSNRAVFLELTKIDVREEVDAFHPKRIEQYNFAQKEKYKAWVSFVGGRGIFSNSKQFLEQRVEELDMADYWKKKAVYAPSTELSNIAKKQRAFLEKYFLPKMTKEDIVCDFACASGEWSEIISPYVGHIDGFDCSEKMIETAKNNAIIKKIDNISYSCMDAEQLHFDRQYDHFILMGLLTCIDDEVLIEHIVQTVSDSLKIGGYLIVRDTLNMSESDKVYYNSLARKYSAVYHPKEVYENIYTRNGFEILQEEYFESYCHRPIEVGSHGYLLRKTQ